MSVAENQIRGERRVIECLIELDRRARTLSGVIPAAAMKEELWHGLAFILDGVRVLSAMDEVRELLPYPQDVTKVPGTREWMLGLANIRGELLPIVDLQHFVGGAPVVITNQSRVLVIRHLGTSTGLLVSSVIGMRHFPVKKRIMDGHFEGALGKYVYDLFALDNDIWPVFNMSGLVHDPRFETAAAA